MEPYLGEIRVFAFGTIPRTWLPCNGQILAVAQNQALFSLLGTTYGGNGSTTFALPDLRGAAMVGTGAQFGLNLPLGSIGGTESVTLNPTQIPAHNHLIQGVEAQGNQPLGGADDYLAEGAVFESNAQSPIYTVNTTIPSSTNPVVLPGDSIVNTGANQPHENRSPYLVVSTCICISGIYPSRN